MIWILIIIVVYIIGLGMTIELYHEDDSAPFWLMLIMWFTSPFNLLIAIGRLTNRALFHWLLLLIVVLTFTSCLSGRYMPATRGMTHGCPVQRNTIGVY